MDQTLVTFLLDRTGSMAKIRSTTIEAFNTYLTELQQEDKVEILFTFLQFDALSLDKLYVTTPVKEVPLLTWETFVPRGGTPLIDAATKTIKAVEEAVIASGKTPKVVVCFQTDGEENASSEHTLEELQALIAARTAEGWQFNFMGASIDAYAQAAVYGIAAGSTVSYDSASLGATQSVFAASARNTRGYATGMSANTSYTVEQKTAAGDVYARPGGALPPPGALQIGQTIPDTPTGSPAAPTGRPKTVADFKL